MVSRLSIRPGHVSSGSQEHSNAKESPSAKHALQDSGLASRSIERDVKLVSSQTIITTSPRSQKVQISKLLCKYALFFFQLRS